MVSRSMCFCGGRGEVESGRSLISLAFCFSCFFGEEKIRKNEDNHKQLVNREHKKRNGTPERTLFALPATWP